MKSKWLFDMGNLSVGQWDFKNISNDSFGADGKTTTPAQTAPAPVDTKSKAAAGVDITAEFSSLANKLYIPYIGVGLGLIGAAYIADKRKSSTIGYLEWMGVLGLLGLGGGVAVALSLGKKQLSAAGDKAKAAAASSTDSAQTTGDLNSQVEKATRDMAMVAASANVPQKKAKSEAEIKTDIDKVQKGLTDNEKKIYVDYINMMADMMKKISASTPTTPATNSPEAMKLFGDMMSGLQGIDDAMEKKYGKDIVTTFNDKMNKLGIL